MSHPVSENENTLGKTAAGFDGGADLASNEDTVSLPPATSSTTAPSGVSVKVSDETFVSSAGEDRATASAASSSKADAAKEQGQQVKDEAVQGGKHVAGVAAEQGQSVAAEAADQAKDLIGQAKSQLADQAATQQENLTSWLRSLADELHQMVGRGSEQGNGDRSSSSSESQSRGADSNGVATKAISQAQGRVKEAADWLEKHEPGDLVDEATRFARRRPGAFLAVAAVGGLLAGRFTRGLKDNSSASSAPSSEDARGAGSPAAPSDLTAPSGYPAVDLPDEQESATLGRPVPPGAPAPFGSDEPYGQGPR